jgi:hypothetical protein
LFGEGGEGARHIGRVYESDWKLETGRT